MSKVQYKHLDLSGASLIQRRHKRQVTPPGMWSVNNFLSSKSDNSISLRPDFYINGVTVRGMSDDLNLQNNDDTLDILNSVSGVYGSSDLIYFTTYIPWGKSSAGYNDVICSTFSTGTATATDGSFTVSFASLGAYDIDQKWWRGCIISIDGDYYVIDRVYASDSVAETGTVVLTMPTVKAYSGVGFTVYRTHNPFRATNNKIELNTGADETLGGSIIYCTPGLGEGISAEDICGPFYSNITETDWAYGSSQYADTQGHDTSAGYNERYTLATNGTSWLWASMAGDELLRRAWAVSKDDQWTSLELADLTLTIPQPNGDDVVGTFTFTTIVRDSTYGYLAGVWYTTTSVSGSPMTRTGIAYSSDNGTTWTVKPDSHYDDGSPQYTAGGVAHDGETITYTVSSSSDSEIRYSTDDGDNWNDTTTITGFAATAETIIKYTGEYFIICPQSEYVYYSSDGQDFDEYDVSGDEAGAGYMKDVAFDGTDTWLFCTTGGGVYKVSTTPGGTYSDVSITIPEGDIVEMFIFQDPVGQRIIVPAYNRFFWTDDNGTTWDTAYLADDKYQTNSTAKQTTNIDYSGQIVAYIQDVGSDNDNGYVLTQVLDRSLIVSYDVDTFQPVSDLYRSQTFAIQDAYLVLIGTREWDSGAWVYHPKRIRWTSPGTYNDFTTAGTGSADIAGPGELLHAASANGRIVVFETTRVGAIVPRGDTDDPFDYDTINDNFRIVSNPIAVDDVVYVIADDGLLWSTDGINCTEVGASFDITEFDDYDEKKPVWLTYSRAQNSLYAFYRNTDDTSHKAYVINIATGGVSSISLTEIDDDAVKAIDPGSVVSIEGSAKLAMMCSHHPGDDASDAVIIARLMIDTPIIGRDLLVDGGDDEYWYADAEFGELYITQEGEKASIKHLLIETYTSATSGDNSDTPYLAAEVKSIEDSDFATSGDTNGTATMTTSALTGSGTAWSTTIAVDADGSISTEQECDGAEDEFTLPCLASQARVYIDDVLYENYTTSGKVITCAVAPASSSTLKAYWENEPEVKVKVGDFFKSTEGWHRVTRIDSAENIILDHYLSTGSETVTHYPAWQLDDGHGRVEIGINRLVEGVQIRLYLIPDYNGTQQSTVAKITGLSIGYVPQGRKIVKATGS